MKFEIGYQDAHKYNASGQPENYRIEVPDNTAEAFAQLYYYGPHSHGKPLRWMGVPILKYPTDLLIYQEIVHELRPDVIVECGTFDGGSALYLAHLCDFLGKGRIVTIDIEARPNRPEHAFIEYLTGSSTDDLMIATVRAKMTGTVLLILDSLHTKEHVFAELKAYAPLADYIIVEDTNINGHPVRPNFGPGPYEAVEQFLSYKIGRGWERDTYRERLLLTANPGGFLRRS